MCTYIAWHITVTFEGPNDYRVDQALFLRRDPKITLSTRLFFHGEGSVFRSDDFAAFGSGFITLDFVKCNSITTVLLHKRKQRHRTTGESLELIGATTITICNGACRVRLCFVLAKKPVEDVGGVSPMSTVLAEDNCIIDGICTQRHEHKTEKWGQVSAHL